MQGIEKMLKMMGIDAEGLKKQAQDFYERIVNLEHRLIHVSDERIAILEAEVRSIKQHFGIEAKALYIDVETKDGEPE